MASTIQLGTTIGISSRFIYNAPLLYVNSGALAYSIGDWVRQFMLAPPFAWRWNRGFAPTVITNSGQIDYVVNLPDFGWLERASITKPPFNDGITPQVTKELTIQTSVTTETLMGEPAWISPIADDNNGNITFRVTQVPDQPYALNIIYQKAAPNFGAVTDTWAPIPDYYSYLYNLGFLAKTYEYKGDERFAFAHQEFLKQVIAANEGISEADKNIFLGPHVTYQRQMQASNQSGALGRQGRSGA